MGLRDVYGGERRRYLIALCQRSHDCTSPGKVPHRTGWQHEPERITDIDEHVTDLDMHLEQGGNVGLVIPDGELVLDIDKTLDGEDCTAENRDRWAAPVALERFEGYPIQITGGRIQLPDGRQVAHGIHVWVDPLGYQPGTTHYDGIPFTARIAGQQVVAEPSVHGSGAQYQWYLDEPPPPATGQLEPVPDPTLWQVKRVAGGLMPRGSRSDKEWRKSAGEQWEARLRSGEIFLAGERHDATRQYIWKLAWGVPLPNEKSLRDISAWGLWFMEHRTDLPPDEIERRIPGLEASVWGAFQKRNDFVEQKEMESIQAVEAEIERLEKDSVTPQEGAPEDFSDVFSGIGIPEQDLDDRPVEAVLARGGEPETQPLEKFPTHVLPEAIRAVADNLGEVLQVDPKIPALVALTAVSAVATARARVHVFDQWTEPLSIFTLLAMESGEGKSPVLTPFTKMLERIELDEIERRKSRNARLAAEGGDDAKDKEAPLRFALYETAPTPAAFTKALGQNNSVLSVFSAEGRGLLAILDGAYQSLGKQEDATPFLSLYSGDSIRASRVTRESPPVYDPTGAICLLSQPDAIERFVANPEHGESGLAARFIVVSGDHRLGYRAPSRDREKRNQAALARLQGTIERIWGSGYPVPDSEPWPANRVEPVVIPAGVGSVAAFYAIDEALEREFRPGGCLYEQPQRGAKLVGLTARLAGLFHVIEEPGWADVELTEDRVWRAWEIARYTISLEAQADEALAGKRSIVQERIVRWMEKHVEVGGSFTWRQLLQAVRSGRVRDADDIREELLDLVAKCHIEAGDSRDQRGRPNRFLRVR